MEIQQNKTIAEQAADSQQQEAPPEDAERFIVGFATIGATYSEEWADDPHFEPPEGVEDGQHILFESSDTLPETLVESVWKSFHDRIVAFDGDGTVVDGVENREHVPLP